MDNKRRALGMGLEELFNNEPLDYGKVEEKILNETKAEQIVEIPLVGLRPNPYQPRKIFDEESLEELSNSIKEHGVFQPIIVKKAIQGYEIIAGERRVKAAQKAGLEKIPAIIKDFNDTEMMEIALLENLQRENLSAIEEANAYKKLQQTLNLSHEGLAKRLGKSRSHITNMLGLLTLPEKVQEAVQNNEISMAHARVLSKLEDSSQQLNLLNQIKREGISVHKLEELTSSQTISKRKNEVTRKKENNEYSYLEEYLSEKLGTKVKIKEKKLIINYTNDKDLNRILEIMKLNDYE